MWVLSLSCSLLVVVCHGFRSAGQLGQGPRSTRPLYVSTQQSRPSDISSLFGRLTKAISYVSEKPARLQYAGAMGARFAFFLSQSLIISQLPSMQSTTVSSTTRAASLDVGAVAGAVVDAILSDSPDAIDAVIPSVSSQSMLGTEEQRSLFAKNFAAIVQLLRQDLRNIENGVYKMPSDLELSHPQWSPVNAISQALNYVQDREAVLVRSRKGKEGGLEIRETFASPKYPEYYLQNFHYQTDGWLSSKSSEIYDFQVESLFMGTADSMRRQIMPAVSKYVKAKQSSGVSVSDLEHLDVATGTGRFIANLLDNFPVKTTCLDLSPFYLQFAKDSELARHKSLDIKYVEAAAEKMPFPDNQFDSISCVYLFHELPMEIRVQVASEFARVLKPGGKLFFVDSAQKGEVPYDRVLEGFTIIAHEPYYLNYTETDLVKLFGDAGLQLDESSVNWVSKCMALTKPL